MAWRIDRLARWHRQGAARQGARLAFQPIRRSTRQRVQPLESSTAISSSKADVTAETSLDSVFATLARRWGRLDFVVHAIAFSTRNELTGK